MKKLILTVVMMIGLSSTAQIGNQQTDTWFDFPNRETLGSKNLISMQYNVFIDPFGKAPNGRGGRQIGIEATALMGWGYIAPSLSTFQQLEDGYTDAVVTFGVNWHMFRTTAVRYYTGFRLGGEFRGGGSPYPLVGLSAGFDVRLITFSNNVSLYIGCEAWADHRSALDDQFYGDSTNYNGGTIFTDYKTRENGKFKIGIRL